ncbi:hsp70 protein [Sarocladium implicatum]|nr:hsp70 protein [Sarocladium implicatum]
MARGSRSQAQQCSTMVVGVDFGTTYSGIAFAHSSSPRHIQVVSNWPDGTNTDKGKCPTLISYEGGKVAAWGYGAVNDPRALKWFKLLLAHKGEIPPNVDASEELKEARDRLRELGKGPVEVIADFLKQLWALAVEKMVKSHSSALVDSSCFCVFLTVPAIWRDDAKAMMRQAARVAGICDSRPAGETILELVAEPEAAILATMSDHFNAASIVDVGECIVVADLGGGTGDCITYKVKSLSPLQMEECVVGDGELCGAVLLDEAFRSFLRSRVGPGTWELIKNDPSIFVTQWEKVIKREFKETSQDQSVTIPCPILNVTRDWKPVVPLPRETLLAIFNTVTTKIIDLVSKQISHIRRHHRSKGPSAKYLVLVGGLGSSHHVYERLRSALPKLGPAPEILQSESDLPWTAIGRGAVLYGLHRLANSNQAIKDAPSFSVRSRIARRSIGTVCTFEEFDPNKHQEKDRRYCPVEDVDVADQQMSWFVEAREPLLEGEVKLCEFTQTFEDENDMEGGITTEFVYSDSPLPPQRCDETVKKLCDVRWTHMPPFDSLPVRITDAGTEVSDLQYAIEMEFKGASAYFAI